MTNPSVSIKVGEGQVEHPCKVLLFQTGSLSIVERTPSGYGSAKNQTFKTNVYIDPMNPTQLEVTIASEGWKSSPKRSKHFAQVGRQEFLAVGFTISGPEQFRVPGLGSSARKGLSSAYTLVYSWCALGATKSTSLAG